MPYSPGRNCLPVGVLGTRVLHASENVPRGRGSAKATAKRFNVVGPGELTHRRTEMVPARRHESCQARVSGGTSNRVTGARPCPPRINSQAFSTRAVGFRVTGAAP